MFIKKHILQCNVLSINNKAKVINIYMSGILDLFLINFENPYIFLLYSKNVYIENNDTELCMSPRDDIGISGWSWMRCGSGYLSLYLLHISNNILKKNISLNKLIADFIWKYIVHVLNKNMRSNCLNIQSCSYRTGISSGFKK